MFTPELADLICERLSTGESLRAVCRDEGMPSEATVRMWAMKDVEGFYSQYAHARDIGLDCRADEVLDVADSDLDPADKRVRFDARRWYLSKMAPKRYGDRLEVDQTTRVQSLSDEELERQISQQLRALQAQGIDISKLLK